MKRLLLLMLLLMTAFQGFSQTKGISYQAVILNPKAQEIPGVNAQNNILANSSVSIQFTVVNASGTEEYQEKHSTRTDRYGMINLLIGTGTQTSSTDFSAIVWNGSTKKLKVEIDFTGGSNFSPLSEQNLTYMPQPPTVEVTIEMTKNSAAITTLKSEQATQNTAIALNTAKAGLTPAQATTISNTTGINTGDQDISGMATNAGAIATLKTEQTIQNTAIALNTAKTGITTKQASDITTNNAKISYPGDQDISGIATNLTAIAAETSRATTAEKANADAIATKVDKEVGKGLTTNDYTTVEKTKLAAITGNNTGDETDATIKAKLGITTLSGDNTGDQDISGIEANATAISTETTRATAAEMVNYTAISNEASAARAAEKDNADAILAEESARIAGDVTNATASGANATNLAQEILDRGLDVDIEEARAMAAEGLNTGSIITNATAIATHSSLTNNPHSVTKTQIELGNVNNTSDADKPVSTLTQTALNLKEDTSNKSTNVTLSENSDNLYPSQKAVKVYVDALETELSALRAQTKPKLGDLRDGGVVFWVDESGNHGLVCALEDYVSTVEWGCFGTDLPTVSNVDGIEGTADTGTGAELGDGITNTNNILNDCDTAPAALAARSLGANWFLPSIKELNEIYVNRAILEGVNGFTPFSDLYWSSTESNNSLAWHQDFFYGGQFKHDKTISHHIRAVRAFTTGEGMIEEAIADEATRAELAEEANSNAINLKADKESPTLTGIPNAPTAAAATNTTQLATTAFVTGALATASSNFVDLSTNQNVAGTKTFSSNGSFNGVNIGVGNAVGSGNLALGRDALNAASTGHRNTAIGYGSLTNYIGSNFDNNTSIGYYNLVGLTTGSGNTSVGAESMMAVQTGIENTSIGNQSLINVTGNQNVGVGKRAGDGITTGSQNTIIGTNANVTTNSQTNATAIGYGAIVDASNKVQIGDALVTAVQLGTGTNTTLETGLVKITGGTPGIGKVLTSDAAGNATWQAPSPSVTTYTIGLWPELGGYVFWVSSDGKHGLVAETVDQGKITWYDAQNTISNPANHSTDGQKFRDWRLPTRFELIEMRGKKAAIGGFLNDFYWNSTEVDPSVAWVFDFTSANQWNIAKTEAHNVRAVRAF